MDWTEFKGYIIGDLTPAFMFAFYIFAMLGMIFSLLMHLYKKSRKERKKGAQLKFNIWYWVSDNLIRFITNTVAIFIVLRFYKQLPIQTDLNMFLGLITGLGIDVVIVMLRNLNITKVFGGQQNNNNG